MRVSEEVEEIVDKTVILAKNADFEYVVPELMLFVICQNEVFARAFENCGGSVRELDYHLRTYLENYMEYRSEGARASHSFHRICRVCWMLSERRRKTAEKMWWSFPIFCVLYMDWRKAMLSTICGHREWNGPLFSRR